MKSDALNEKRERFRKLAAARTDAVIEKIRVLSNCSNPQIYEYSDNEVEKIFNVIEEQLKIAKAKFRKVKSGFSFDM
jgi:hypothetical protein